MPRMHELFKSTDFNNLNINCTTSDVKYTLNVNGHVTVRRRSFKVSVSTMTRRSVVGVTHLPAIHRAGQLGLQIAVSGPPPLDATELKPSSVTNCLTAIPVGFTPCSMNCSKRLLDAVPYRKKEAGQKTIFCDLEVSSPLACPKSSLFKVQSAICATLAWEKQP